MTYGYGGFPSGFPAVGWIPLTLKPTVVYESPLIIGSVYMFKPQLKNLAAYNTKRYFTLAHPCHALAFLLFEGGLAMT
jgi:hypothetical protein